MADENKTLIDLNNLPPAVQEYMRELRKTSKESRLQLKEALVLKEAAEKEAADLKAEKEAAKKVEQQRVDVRNLSKEEYKKYKQEFYRNQRVNYRLEREKLRAEQLANAVPKHADAKPEGIPNVRGMTKEEYRKIKEAFRRGMQVR